MQKNNAGRRYYPILLDLQGKPCLVAGGGTVAERKVLTLLESNAVVTVVSPACTDTLGRLAESGRIIWLQKIFEPSDLQNIHLVIAATDNPDVNSAVFREAAGLGLLVNVIDNPDECTFIVPSVVERGDLLIAISTSGASPALAKKIRKELEATFGDEYAIFLQIMAELREKAIKDIPEENTRRLLFRKLVDSDILQLLKEGKSAEAGALAEAIYKASLA